MKIIDIGNWFILLFKNWDWTTILSLVGALAWLPWLIERFSTVKIEGKVLSLYSNYEKNGNTLLILKLSLICTNKDYKYVDISADTYSVDDDIHQLRSWSPRAQAFTNNAGTEELIGIAGSEYLNNMLFLKKGEVTSGYLNLRGGNAPKMIFKKIVLTFTDCSGKSKKISLPIPESEKLFYDDSLFTPVTQEIKEKYGWH